MNLLKLFSLAFLLMFSFTVNAQKSGESPFKKGEGYHVLIEETLIFTKDVYGLLEKHNGKTKLILQHDKAEPRDYKISKLGKKLLSESKYFKVDRQTPWASSICHCWVGYRFIEIGCGQARNPDYSCDDCCGSMIDELPWYKLI